MPAPPAAVQVVARGHGARERARRQHRHLRALRLRHQLEQGHRSVSTLLSLLLHIRARGSAELLRSW